MRLNNFRTDHIKKGSQQSRNVPMTTPRVTKALCSFRQEELRRLRSFRTENTENNIVNVKIFLAAYELNHISETFSDYSRTWSFWAEVLPNQNFCFYFLTSDMSRQYQQFSNQPGGPDVRPNIYAKKIIWGKTLRLILTAMASG